MIEDTILVSKRVSNASNTEDFAPIDQPADGVLSHGDGDGIELVQGIGVLSRKNGDRVRIGKVVHVSTRHVTGFAKGQALGGNAFHRHVICSNTFIR